MASNSKKRRRVLGASCILAALIIASSSFAWFTSKDEVTNRLSANADYDVSIVESFAPPKNFLPGQEVNKDVYATNTGSIGAFVEETVTSKMSVTKEVDLSTTFTDGVVATNKTKATTPVDVDVKDCVELTKDEVYSIEAGSYLAYAPAASDLDLGDIVVKYPDATMLYQNNTDKAKYITDDEYAKLSTAEKASYTAVTGTMYRLKTSPYTLITKAQYGALDDTAKADYVETTVKNDFTPDKNGLYVFRRYIDVMSNGGEFFEYGAYYYNDGKYYKVNNLVVTPDNLLDFANDGEITDGQLTTATGNLVQEVKEVVVPELSYDAANNRLIATYKGNAADMTTYKNAAKDLDEAEHNLAKARAELQRALQDKASSDADVAKWTNSVAELEKELDAVNARITELNNLIGSNTVGSETGINKQIADQTAAKNTAETNAKSALADLYGASNNDFNTSTGDITFDETASGHDTTGGLGSTLSNTLYYKKLKAEEDLAALKQNSNYGSDMFNAYKNEVCAKLNLTATNYADFDALVASGDVKWDQLASLTFDGTATAYSADKLNFINRYTVAKLEAEDNYKAKLATAKNEIGKYLAANEALGTANSYTASDATATYGAQPVTWDNYTTTGTTGSGLNEEKARLQAELDTLTDKKTELIAGIGTAMGAATTAATVNGNSATAEANLTTATNDYNTAYSTYQQKLDAYNNAKFAYENSGDIKVYINLSDDVVTYGGIADKWQLLPTALDDNYDNVTGTEYDAATAANSRDGKKDTATFYYTGILQGGETSTKLIDSVELDKGTTQYMYKDFDFDINIGMKSAQVTYDEAGNVLATAALDELDATGVTITDPANEKTTALTWS